MGRPRRNRSVARTLLVVLAMVIGLSACTPSQFQYWFGRQPDSQQELAAAGEAWNVVVFWYNARRAAAEYYNQIHNHPFLVCVRAHESDRAGGYSAYNSSSGAAGAYQFIAGTWAYVSSRAGYPGYGSAANAPAHVQDAVAYDTAISRGERFHWAGSGC